MPASSHSSKWRPFFTALASDEMIPSPSAIPASTRTPVTSGGRAAPAAGDQRSEQRAGAPKPDRGKNGGVGIVARKSVNVFLRHRMFQ
jgi:hypothetical protein